MGLCGRRMLLNLTVAGAPLQMPPVLKSIA